MIVVPTIPHTGSMFVVQHLLGHLPRIRNPKRGDGVFFAHVYPERMAEILSLRDHPAIVPIRNPAAVAMSWKGQGWDLSQLWVLWDEMLKVHKAFSPYYLPIDHVSREARLAEINELGLKLKTDWPIVASKGLSAPLSADERHRAEQLLDGPICTAAYR